MNVEKFKLISIFCLKVGKSDLKVLLPSVFCVWSFVRGEADADGDDVILGVLVFEGVGVLDGAIVGKGSSTIGTIGIEVII